jgi:uncharacterized repeat protein (TIGR01451 family)
VTYTLTVTNNGPATATNVVLTDTIPASGTLVSAPPGCVFTAPTLTCTIASLASGATQTFTYDLIANAVGTLSNSASVTANETDSVPGNNSASATTAVNANYLGPTPYLQASDSPFFAQIQAGTVLLETFEDSLLNVPGVTANVGTIGMPSFTNDSVDADDGSIDGNGNTGHSFFALGLPGIRFTFNPTVLGGYPTQVGIVWTDGAGTTSFEAFDASGQSLGVFGPFTLSDGSFLGGTSEDRFFGIVYAGGISAIHISNTIGDVEVDHLQFNVGSLITDLALTKADAPDPVVLGSNLTYTLTVSNIGTGLATGVVLTDLLPGGTTLVSATSTQGVCSGTTTITCSLGFLTPGSSADVIIVVTSTAAGSLTNTASVAFAGTDVNTANDTATSVTTVNPVTADLTLTKSSAPNPIILGTGNVVYTLTVSNNGPQSATGVVLTDPLPTSVTFVSSSASQGSCSGTTTVTCNLGTLASGATATVDITVTPLAAGAVVNSASVSANETDPVPTDNSTSTVTTVNPASADLSVTATDSPDPVVVGSNFVLTATAANSGPSGATGVVLTFSLPAGAIFVSSAASQGSCTFGPPATVTCTLGNLASGATATADVTLQATAAGTLSTNMSVVANEADPNTANNSFTEQTTARVLTADLALTKVGSQDPVPATGNLSYTLVVTNNGPDPASNIVLTDTLPAGVNFVSANASQGSCTGTTTVTCNLIGLLSGTSATVTIVIIPPTPGVITNTATVSAMETDPNPADNSASVTTSVIVGPTITLSGSVLNFASQPVGTTSTPQTITISNTGNSPLNFSSFTVSGQFTQSNTCGTSLAVGASCILTVNFAPTQAGALAGLITIVHNAPGSPTVISLTGTGVNAPAIQLSTTSLVFGSRPIGSPSPPQSITLTNTGNATLNIQSITISGADFTQTNNCGSQVAAGARCSIDVVFNPTASGLLTGGLMITSDARGSVPIVTLTGFGVAQGVTLSTSVVVFPAQLVGTTSAAQTVMLTNNGAPLTISNIAISGPFAQTNNCTSPVPTAGSCTIQVTFTPTQAGAASGSLTITDSGAGSPRTVALSGTGVTATVSLNPVSLTFGAQTVGSTSAAQQVTLTNSGATPVNISGVTTSSEFTQTNNCGSTLATGASCVLNVTFTPAAGGLRTGTLTITTNAVGSPHVINLTGTGVQTGPVVTLSPSSLTFGAQIVGTTSAPQMVTLTNSGTATLNISSIAVAGDFAQTNTCTASLTPAATCTISVTFTPTLAGTRVGTVTITDDSATSPEVIQLSGQGLPSGPTVQLSSMALSFGNQDLNTTSAAQTVTLTNTGNAALTINSITASGDYQQSHTCGTTVAVGGSCTISITFRPTNTGIRNGAITVDTNAAGSPHTIALTGNGTSFTITTAPGAPTQITINPGQAAVYDLTLSPTSGFSGTVTLACTGLPAGAVCSFSQNPVTVTAPVTIRVTITTTAPSGGWTMPTVGRFTPPDLHHLPLITLAAMLAIARLRRLALLRRRNALALAMMLLLAVVAGGCAGGISAPSPVGRTPGTPTGTYNVTVSATSASGHSQSFNLTVTVR